MVSDCEAAALLPTAGRSKGTLINMSEKWIAGGLLLGLLSFPAALLAADAEGCKDSPLIARLPGSTLDKCGHQDRRQGHHVGSQR